MKTHFENLLDSVPDLCSRPVLDLGSGRGKFLVDLAKHGVKAVGLEINPDYINLALNRARQEGINIEVRQGTGEMLTFKDGAFGFVNVSEVLEHVISPKKVMFEVWRVLQPAGLAYVSVPNRYGLKDQHFNLYFVNWLPRHLSEIFISIFGKHKNYDGNNGLQRLSDMHYFSYRKAKKFFESLGFVVRDIRANKIEKRFKGLKKVVIKIVYTFLKPWYFDSFHFLLEKKIKN